MTPSADTILGLLGTGKIGSAIMTGFCSENGWRPKHAFVSARTMAKAETLVAKFPDRVSIGASNQEIVDKSDVIFIGLLPNVAREVLPKISFVGKKVISMMATIPYDELLQLVKLPSESVVRSVPLPVTAKRSGPILAYPDNTYARDLFAQIGTPVMLAEEAEITKLAGITALISYFYATCNITQQWCVNNGVGTHICSVIYCFFYSEMWCCLGQAVKLHATLFRLSYKRWPQLGQSLMKILARWQMKLRPRAV